MNECALGSKDDLPSMLNEIPYCIRVKDGRILVMIILGLFIFEVFRNRGVILAGEQHISKVPQETKNRNRIQNYRMMAYVLSIEISGAGEDPQHRSHWGFTMQKPSSPIRDLLHVEVIDLDRLWYQFESRMGTGLHTMQAIGEVKLGELNEQQRQQAIQVITSSPAPRDGKKRCQDWVYDTLLSLEIEELVPSGTCHFWKGMVGKSARAVQETPGVNWTSLT